MLSKRYLLQINHYGFNHYGLQLQTSTCIHRNVVKRLHKAYKMS